MEELQEQFKAGRGSVICWEIDDETGIPTLRRST